ncbi:TPA: hypothetical protein ACGIK9_003353 [Acinetobacter baumannii]|uniref:hypothetical protein n=1 Tax=Acinetobacter baumannii TaxID=470 RepID=UPI00338F8931
MFKIGPVQSHDVLNFKEMDNQKLIAAIIEGFKTDRLIKLNLVDFESIDDPSNIFTFKLVRQNIDKDAVLIKLVKETSVIHLCFTAVPINRKLINYEILIYPTRALLNATQDEITAYVHENLFLLAFIMLKSISSQCYEVNINGAVSKYQCYVTALYESFMGLKEDNILIQAHEPDEYESNEVKFFISPEQQRAEIHGEGVAASHITVIEILARMNSICTDMEVNYFEVES